MAGLKLHYATEVIKIVLPLVKLMYVGKSLQRHETWTCIRR
jgi:hypothetical protein